jgi:hypothetical protein
MRRWLVLAIAPARLFTRRLAYWPICYELCSVSPRDEYGGADRLAVTAPLHDFATIGCAGLEDGSQVIENEMLIAPASDQSGDQCNNPQRHCGHHADAAFPRSLAIQLSN